jgi:tRNA(fMet)-specific endonuclease VapC
MKFLLDTNAVIAIFKNVSKFCETLRRHNPADFGVSAIVMYELAFGAFFSARIPENLSRLHALQFEIIPFDREDAEAAGDIRAKLTKAGQLIGPYDLLIDGQAKARNLTLITGSNHEFARVDGLKVEDWEERL